MTNNLPTGLVLVIAFNLIVGHWRRTGNIDREVVGVGGAVDGDGPLGLRPRGAVGAMRVYDAPNGGPLFVQQCVGKRIAAGA